MSLIYLKNGRIYINWLLDGLLRTLIALESRKALRDGIAVVQARQDKGYRRAKREVKPNCPNLMDLILECLAQRVQMVSHRAFLNTNPESRNSFLAYYCNKPYFFAFC